MIAASDVRRAFENLDASKPSLAESRMIAAALPTAARATGWSEAEILEIVIIQRDGGSVERLLAMTREDAS